MRPNATVRQLRGKDPVTVEIELNALANKPIGQIACDNVADLYALEEVEDLATGLRVRLRGFHDRFARAIADLHSGPGFQGWLEALAEVDPGRVPASLRQVIAGQVDNAKRSPDDVTAVEALMATWSEVEPEAFVFGAPKQVQQVPEPKRRESSPRARSTSSERSASKASKATSTGNPAQDKWLRQVLLERLAGAMERGLLEVVLIAGARHRARETFPGLTDREVKVALKGLETDGMATHSAGRWKRPLRPRSR